MNSAVSFSRRSAASATDLFTRAEASPTLRLKSFMLVPRTFERENYHALLADARLRHYFVLPGRGSIGGIPVYTPRQGQGRSGSLCFKRMGLAPPRRHAAGVVSPQPNDRKRSVRTTFVRRPSICVGIGAYALVLST